MLRLACVGAAFLASCVSVYDEDARAAELLPRSGVVVSEQRLATEAGLDVLERGGNAADAAVATAFALAVVYPQAGNLGGGGFAVLVPHTGTPRAYDFRERAPAGYRPDLYLDERGERVPERSLVGPLAVGVPGTPAGLWMLHRRHGSGRLTFADLVRPAIRLARGGFEVDPVLAALLADPAVREKLVTGGAGDLFYPEGVALGVGDRLVQPRLARTLERIAESGERGFYRGPVASAIVACLAEAVVPGTDGERVAPENAFVEEDLRAYEVVQREPLRGWFRGNEIVTMPPPSSGGVCLLQILAILEGLPLDADRRSALAGEAPREGGGGGEFGEFAVVSAGHGLSERMLHWWIEAMRCSFADRAQHLGDPDFVDVPVEELLSREWISKRRISIGEQADEAVEPMPAPQRDPFVPLDKLGPEATAAKAASASGGREGTQTTHLSVLDREGNAVALTTTLNAWFGSGLYVADAGFLLNDELDDFSIQAGSPNQFGLVGGDANALAPGRRPLSSMTPTVVRDHRGVVRLVLGSPGGPKIITSVAEVLLRMLVLRETLAEAVSAPRLHQQWRPATTSFERGWPDDVLEALRTNRRHSVSVSDALFGSVQAIAVDERGRVEGVSDPRRGGVAGIEGERLPAARPPARTPEELPEAAPER